MKLLEDNSEALQRMSEDQEKKKQFINDLKKQIVEDELKKLNKKHEDVELSK